MVDWDAIAAVLKAINWAAVSSIATAAALLVSSAVFRVQLVDRRRLRADQDRAQAEQVAGWLTFDREEKSWTAHVLNGSTQPVYDVLYVVRDAGDSDAAMPEIIPVIPPETTWSWPVSLFGSEFFENDDSEDEVEIAPDDGRKWGGIYELYNAEGDALYVGSVRKRAPDDPVNARAYMTFRDGRGLTWQRDSHGRLTSTRRRIDWAPRPNRLTGRIRSGR